MVGDFYQRALRGRVIDGRARFAEYEETHVFASLGNQVRGWWTQLFSRDKANDATAPRPAPRRPALPAPEADVTPPASTPMASASSAPVSGGGSGEDESSLALDRGETVMAVPPGFEASTAQAPTASPAPVTPAAPAPPPPYPAGSIPPAAPAYPAGQPAPAAPVPAPPATPATPDNNSQSGVTPG
ncbi:hypothetical protein D9M68_525530 [compost metagenome]